MSQEVTDSRFSFVMRRLHSLSGIVPIGLFLIYHMYFALYAWQGPAVYNAKLNELHSMPTAWAYLVFEIVFIYLPILFHGFYGLALTTDAKINLKNFPLFGNLSYVLQRISGVGLFLFIGVHVLNSRIIPILKNVSDTWSHLHHAFTPAASGNAAYLTLAVYILGTAGAAYHLANGVWLFSIRWGLVTSESGMKRLRIGSLLFYVILQAWVLISLAGFIFGKA